MSSFMSSLLRHATKYLKGDRSEDHLAAIGFNVFGLMRGEKEIKEGAWPASYDDLPGRVCPPGVSSRVVMPATAPIVHRVYVAGPFSGPTNRDIRRHISVAGRWGRAIRLAGHIPHVPHMATGKWHGYFNYEDFMEIDRTYLEHWATAIFVIGVSPGVRREIEWATAKGLPIWRCPTQIPGWTPTCDHSLLDPLWDDGGF